MFVHWNIAWRPGKPVIGLKGAVCMRGRDVIEITAKAEYEAHQNFPPLIVVCLHTTTD